MFSLKGVFFIIDILIDCRFFESFILRYKSEKIREKKKENKNNDKL